MSQKAYVHTDLEVYQLAFETANLFFLGSLMPTAGEGLVTLLRQVWAPVMQRTVSNAQLSCHLADTLAACPSQLHGF